MYNFFIRLLTYPFIILLDKIFNWILGDDTPPDNKNKKIVEDP
jgi:hypothetical protein